MQSNIGVVDRYIRLASGILAVGAALGMRRGRGSRIAKAALLSFGAMKIAEGVTGFCPLMYAAGVKSLPQPQTSEGGQASAQRGAGMQQESAQASAGKPGEMQAVASSAAPEAMKGGWNQKAGDERDQNAARSAGRHSTAEDAGRPSQGRKAAGAGDEGSAGRSRRADAEDGKSAGGDAKSIERVLIRAAEDLKAAVEAVGADGSSRGRRKSAPASEDTEENFVQ